MARTSGKTDAAAIALHNKKLKAVRIREDGFSLEEIAGSLGWNSPQAAQKAIKSLLDKAELEIASHYKLLQVRRLERLLAVHIEKAEKGNVHSGQLVVRVSKRLSEIVGCDSPAKFAHTDIDGNDKPQVIVYLPDNARDEK